jgi:hypothetical protein
MTESASRHLVPSTELLASVVNCDIAGLLGEKLDKAVLLAALTARGELSERLRAGRWHALEQARAAGASWAEIDTAELPWGSGSARDDYERALARQRAHGLVDLGRSDPGPPEPCSAPPEPSSGRLLRLGPTGTSYDSASTAPTQEHSK